MKTSQWANVNESERRPLHFLLKAGCGSAKRRYCPSQEKDSSIRKSLRDLPLRMLHGANAPPTPAGLTDSLTRGETVRSAAAVGESDRYMALRPRSGAGGGDKGGNTPASALQRKT